MPNASCGSKTEKSFLIKRTSLLLSLCLSTAAPAAFGQIGDTAGGADTTAVSVAPPIQYLVPDKTERIALTPAINSIKRGDYAAALSLLNHYMKDHKGSSIARLYRGHCQLKLGHAREALADYEASQKLPPKLMRSCYWPFMAQAHFDCGEFAKAIANWGKVLELNAADVHPRELRANAYMRMGKSSEAMTEIIAGLSARSIPNTYMGTNFHWHMEQPHISKDTLKHWDRAVVSNKTDAGPYLGRALVYMAISAYPQALADINRALALDPALTAARQARILNLTHLHQFDKAREDAHKLLSGGTSKQVNNWLLLAFTYLRANEVDGGIKDIEQLFKANLQNPIPLYARAWMEEKSQRPKLALADLDKAIEISPKFFEARQLRGFMRDKRGDRAHAIEDLNVCLAGNPPMRYCLLGERSNCYFDLHQYDKAVADLKEMLVLNETAITHKSLALCYEEMGQHNTASREQAMASALESASLSQ